MGHANWIRSAMMFVLGAVLGGFFVASWERPVTSAQQANPQWRGKREFRLAPLKTGLTTFRWAWSAMRDPSASLAAGMNSFERSASISTKGTPG